MNRDSSAGDFSPERTFVSASQDRISSPLGDQLFDDAAIIQVEVLGGPMDGNTHFSSNGVLLIGRSRDCDFVLDADTRISGQHARLTLKKGLLWLEDMCSTNGTYLGSERLTSMVPVAPGVQFTIGATLLEILT